MPDVSREQLTLVTASLLLLAAIGGAMALDYTEPVMMPLALSVLFSYLVRPMVDWLERRMHAPRAFAVFIAFVVISAGWALLIILLYASARGLLDNADHYQQRLSQIGEWVIDLTQYLPASWAPELSHAEGIDPEKVLGRLELGPFIGALQQSAGDLLTMVSTMVTNGLLISIFLVYLLIGRRAADDSPGILGEIESNIESYLITKALVSAATGLGTWLLLSLIGLDLALVFGVLAFLLNFIPSLGSIIASLLPLPIALIQFDNPVWIAASVLLPGSLQFLVGNVIEPKLMGDLLDLHPITILLTLIFWGLLWGPVGMILAVPMTAVVKIVASKIETTRPISELLAGRLSSLAPRSTPDLDPDTDLQIT